MSGCGSRWSAFAALKSLTLCVTNTQRPLPFSTICPYSSKIRASAKLFRPLWNGAFFCKARVEARSAAWSLVPHQMETANIFSMRAIAWAALSGELLSLCSISSKTAAALRRFLLSPCVQTAARARLSTPARLRPLSRNDSPYCPRTRPEQSAGRRCQ